MKWTSHKMEWKKKQFGLFHVCVGIALWCPEPPWKDIALVLVGRPVMPFAAQDLVYFHCDEHDC